MTTFTGNIWNIVWVSSLVWPMQSRSLSNSCVVTAGRCGTSFTMASTIRRKALCMLFDCGATFQGALLNSELLQGPDLTSSLLVVLQTRVSGVHGGYSSHVSPDEGSWRGPRFFVFADDQIKISQWILWSRECLCICLVLSHPPVVQAMH